MGKLNPRLCDRADNRRIGRNEIAAIRTSRAYVDAQKDFFALTGQDGHAEYAQRLASSAGKVTALLAGHRRRAGKSFGTTDGSGAGGRLPRRAGFREAGAIPRLFLFAP